MMGIRAEELSQRVRAANRDIKVAMRSFAKAEGIDTAAIHAKSLFIELGYNPKSEPSIPVAIKRLIKSAYTDQFPVWALRFGFGLVYDPSSPHLAPGERYVTTIDIAVHGHKNPSARELEEGKIAVGRRESLFGPVIAIEADVEPLKYMVEMTSLLRSSRSKSVIGTHHIGDVGPAVIEAGIKILTSHRRIDPDAQAKQLLEQANYGRIRRATGAIKQFVFPKAGFSTETPSVCVELHTPAARLI